MTTEHHESKPGVPSKALLVIAAGKSATLTLADLQAMPQRTLVVHNAHSNVDETYSGVGLGDLLAKYGLTLENGGAKKVYHSYVKAEGTDGYWVIYSASELKPPCISATRSSRSRWTASRWRRMGCSKWSPGRRRNRRAG